MIAKLFYEFMYLSLFCFNLIVEQVKKSLNECGFIIICINQINIILVNILCIEPYKVNEIELTMIKKE